MLKKVNLLRVKFFFSGHKFSSKCNFVLNCQFVSSFSAMLRYSFPLIIVLIQVSNSVISRTKSFFLVPSELLLALWTGTGHSTLCLFNLNFSAAKNYKTFLSVVFPIKLSVFHNLKSQFPLTKNLLPRRIFARIEKQS